jgi:hypothetical protein
VRIEMDVPRILWLSLVSSDKKRIYHRLRVAINKNNAFFCFVFK